MRSLLFVAAALTLTSDATLDSARDLELTVRVDGDKLVTWNPTDEPELVILQDPWTGASSSFFVPALSRAELDIPCEISRDVRLFASVRTDAGLFYTDQWSLADVALSGDVWLELDQGVALSWTDCEAGFLPTAPTGPPPSSSMLITTTSSHVPVITPYDTTCADTPPPLPKEPLPPL